MKCLNLEVWKKSAKLSSEIYIYFKNFTDFGFKDQITRAGLSIASNIAEGIERISDKDTVRFLDFARGSVAELQTQIYIGMKIEYVEGEQGKKWIKDLEEIGKMLSSMIINITKDLKDNSNDY
jgi:four helix bundle protein